jgi:hypothetical protein
MSAIARFTDGNWRSDSSVSELRLRYWHDRDYPRGSAGTRARVVTFMTQKRHAVTALLDAHLGAPQVSSPFETRRLRRYAQFKGAEDRLIVALDWALAQPGNFRSAVSAT